MKLPLRFILAAVLGLATTLVLAWGPLLLDSTAGRTARWSNAQFWIDDTYAGHYQIRRARFVDTVRMLHITFAGTPKEQPFYKSDPPPAWSYKLTHANEGEGRAAGQPWWSVDTIAAGWPMRAFRGGEYESWRSGRAGSAGSLSSQATIWNPVQQPPAAGPLTVGLHQFGGPTKDRYSLPFYPVPLGLAVNILTFALAWLVVLASFAALRSWHRVRHGRCRACNYHLVGLTPGARCPECGRPAR